jgi:hypothetical protein
MTDGARFETLELMPELLPVMRVSMAMAMAMAVVTITYRVSKVRMQMLKQWHRGTCFSICI